MFFNLIFIFIFVNLTLKIYEVTINILIVEYQTRLLIFKALVIFYQRSMKSPIENQMMSYIILNEKKSLFSFRVLM